MEKLIMNEFSKTNSKAGHVIMMRNIHFELAKNLNPKQKDDLYNSIESLISKGFIIYEESSEFLRLTEDGYRTLYKNSKTLEEIENLIMNEFEKQNSRVNDFLLDRNLRFDLLQNLNPIEAELFEVAITSLISKGFVTYEEGRISGLRLTEIGYNSLY